MLADQDMTSMFMYTAEQELISAENKQDSSNPLKENQANPDSNPPSPPTSESSDAQPQLQTSKQFLSAPP